MRVSLITVLLCAALQLIDCGYSPAFAQSGAVGHVQQTGLQQRFSGPDFNPVLLQGTRGYPGIRARINQRAFQYASSLVADVLNTEIKKARIPPISQCIPMVSGCVQIYNLYVSRYRCPQRVVLYPAPPNRVVLTVQNVDIGVTGNLGGQIVVLVPIVLSGIVQLNIHQATITVELSIERGQNGPYIRVESCNMQIGYADAYIENGGLIGDIVNSQFRSQISNQVKSMIPGQVCGQIPTLVNEKINSKLSALPQSIALTQMINLIGPALGLTGGSTPAGGCSAACGQSAASAGKTPQVLPSIAPAPVIPRTPDVAPVATPNIGAAPAPSIPTNAYSGSKKYVARARGLNTQYNTDAHVAPSGLSPLSHTPQLRTYRNIQHYNYDAHLQNQPHRILYVPAGRAKRQAVAQQLYLRQLVNAPVQQQYHPQARANGVPQFQGAAPPQQQQQHYQTQQQQQQQYRTNGVPQYQGAVQHPQQFGTATGVVGRPGAAPRFPPPPTIAAVPPPHAQGPPPVCNCPHTPQEDPASFLRQVAAHLDMTKLNDIYLSLQLYNTYATSNDFTVDLSGEFSPNAQGGTPFGAFPTAFPSAYDTHMAEFIVTDYTVNTLFYHLHRKQFLSFKIGPDTPKIGELLKTTCSDDEDDLEATDVELDEEEARRRRRLASQLSQKKRSKRSTVILGTPNATRVVARGATLAVQAPITTITTKRKRDSRARRQDDSAGLADLGICFGDILPAVREKYPNKKISINIRTSRAPSLILSSARGGTAILDLIADADIYIDGTNTRVGTITIAATVQIVVQINGNKLTGSAEITQLKLTDAEQTLGLPQDALDNLGNLGKELLQKVANDGLQKGIPINIPQNLPLPVGIVNPTVRIIEHGVYIATDFTVSPSLLGGGGGIC